MGERSFRVCDYTAGSSTCDERNVQACVVCSRDMCASHRDTNTRLEIRLFGNSGTAAIAFVDIGVTCPLCRAAVNSGEIRDLIVRSLIPEEIIRLTKAHLSAKALK